MPGTTIQSADTIRAMPGHMARLTQILPLALALCCFTIPFWASPSVQAQRAFVIPAERAGIKGMAGHWWYADRYGPRLLDEFTALGVTNVRLAVDWLHIEAVQGEVHFEKLDPIIFGLRDRGIEVIPVIATMPPWATWNGAECFESHLKCRLNREQVKGFQTTMSLLVQRYSHIRNWEFWNEPEMWENMRDPAEYEFWYRAFHKAAKEANPAARVAVSTLTGWDFAGRLSSDLPYDAISVHSYGDHRNDPVETDKVYKLYQGIRSGGRDVPVWLTEYGWNSTWLDNRGRVEALDWTMQWLLETPFVEFAHYHMLHDTEEYWECCFGLLTAAPDFIRKQPAWDRFQSYTVQGR
jgi:hypothetical protein